MQDSSEREVQAIPLDVGLPACQRGRCTFCVVKNGPKDPSPEVSEAVSEQFSLLLLDHKRRLHQLFVNGMER